MSVTLNQKIAHGKPVIEGTRITVEFILELLSSGMSNKDIIKEYPQLKNKDVVDALSYAKKSISHEEIIKFPLKAA